MVCQFLLYNKVNQLYIYICLHISSSCVSLPPTLPIPPLQVVTKHRADLPVLCGCFPLAIYFTSGSVYMSMPLSHFVTTYPSPSPCPQVHSLVGLCLYSRLTPRFFMSIFFFLDSIHMCQHTVFVFLFLTYFTLYDRLQEMVLIRIAQPGGESAPHLELAFEGPFQGGEAPVGIFPSFLLQDSDCPQRRNVNSIVEALKNLVLTI